MEHLLEGSSTKKAPHIPACNFYVASLKSCTFWIHFFFLYLSFCVVFFSLDLDLRLSCVCVCMCVCWVVFLVGTGF